jgi:hypothetical protein
MSTVQVAVPTLVKVALGSKPFHETEVVAGVKTTDETCFSYESVPTLKRTSFMKRG